MRRSKLLSSIILIAIFCLLSQRHAAAVNVMPTTIELDAKAGETYTGSFEVANSTDNAAAPIRVYMEDWDRMPNGDYVISMAGSLDRSCSAWMSLSPTQFDVRYNESIDVKYTFTVPANATGSYWTYFMVEGVKKPAVPPSERDGVQVFIGAKMRYAVRFVVNVSSGRQVKGAITEISVAAKTAAAPVKNAPLLEAKIVFKNTGNSYVKPVGYFEIRNLDGEKIYLKDIEQFFVFPGRDKWVAVPIETELKPGEYIAMAVLDYGGDNFVAGESRFIVPLAEGDAANSPGGK
jgi:hypothetical protein